MDALVAKVDHAVACLSDLSTKKKLSSFYTAGETSTSWIFEGSAEDLNWDFWSDGTRELLVRIWGCFYVEHDNVYDRHDCGCECEAWRGKDGRF